MKLRAGFRICVGHYREYPETCGWPEYEYKCPECNAWHRGSSTTQVFEDGTEAYLCPECEEEMEMEETQNGGST